METENKELKAQVKSSGPGMQEITEGGANLVDKETLSVITDATKSLARRVRSNLGGTISFSKMHQQDKSDDSDTSPSTSGPPIIEDPTGIKKAFEDAEVLKAIVSHKVLYIVKL